jgi:hypothetical protein
MVIAVTTIAVAGFKWPTPTHGAIFSIRGLKSKPGVPVAAMFDTIENRQKWKIASLNVFFSSHPLTPEVKERE